MSGKDLSSFAAMTGSEHMKKQKTNSIPPSVSHAEAWTFPPSLRSPLLRPLSWHPRSSEATRHSHRKTTALPPDHAACHQTHLWVSLQDNDHKVSKTLQQAQVSWQKCGVAQKLAININPRDEYCWRKIWASLQLYQVNCKPTWVTTAQVSSLTRETVDAWSDGALVCQISGDAAFVLGCSASDEGWVEDEPILGGVATSL